MGPVQSQERVMVESWRQAFTGQVGHRECVVIVGQSACVEMALKRLLILDSFLVFYKEVCDAYLASNVMVKVKSFMVD